MNTNGISDRHWLRVGLHFAADAVMFYLAILVGISLRFIDEWNLLLTALWYNWPGILAGSLVFSCAAYITGLYSWTASRHSVFKRGLLLLFCLGIALGLMMTAFYIHYVGRIGRGALLLGSAIAFLSIFAHHALLLRRQQNFRERLAFIVTSKFDEVEIALNEGLWGSRLQLVGVVHDDTYRPAPGTHTLGHVNDLPEIVRREGISRVLCTNQSISNPALCKIFCQLRYSGVTVMPLISLCEEVHQLVPVELITPEWLLNASGSPEMIYIKKIKRGFDIISSLAGLILLSPFLLFGIIAVRLSSPGPVFYFQTRMGRFGRQIKIVKLRTMALDAEKSGAVWAKENDPRVTPVGKVLRRYRIDEIPQLLNVLKGQMSLVGPRPERPQFVTELAQRVPYYQERLMVQPGITGWAQVNYPYGASFEDARRKLEYDLYYMKHMSLFLDLFILLDTVRIILLGGLKSSQKSSMPRYATSPRNEVSSAPSVQTAVTVPPQ